MTATPRKDQELDALLAPDSAVARAWREASAQVSPPEALDDAIRAAARRAVKAGPLPAGGAGRPRWRVPLSIAALVVISGTLTFLVAEREERSLMHDQPSDSKALGDESSKRGAAINEPARAAREAPGKSDQPRAQVLSPSSLKPGTAGERDAERKSQKAIPPAATTPPKAVAGDEGGLGSVPLAVQPESVPVAKEKVPSGGSGASEPAQPGAEGQAAKDEALARKPLERSGRVEPQVPPAPASRDAVPAQAESAQTAEGQAGRQSSEPTRTDQLHEQQAAQSSVTAAATSPQEWLRRIADMRNRGRLDEAERELRAFRERYPDYPLPPELR